MYVVYVYGICIWYTYIAYVYGICTWYMYMVYVYGICIWCMYMLDRFQPDFTNQPIKNVNGHNSNLIAPISMIIGATATTFQAA